jgi:hypothetical protein
VDPCGVACSADAEPRHDVVEAPEGAVDHAKQPGREPRLHALLDVLQNGVEAHVVAVLRTAVLGGDIEGEASVADADRQVVVDVGVHAGERELDRGHALVEAGSKQRCPRP